MSSVGSLSYSLTGKNESADYAKKPLYTDTTSSDINAQFKEIKSVSVIFVRTRLQETESWCHIRKQTPRVPLIKSLIENRKHPRIRHHLRKSIFAKKTETQEISNLKRKITHQEPIMPPNIRE